MKPGQPYYLWHELSSSVVSIHPSHGKAVRHHPASQEVVERQCEWCGVWFRPGRTSYAITCEDCQVFLNTVTGQGVVQLYRELYVRAGRCGQCQPLRNPAYPLLSAFMVGLGIANVGRSRISGAAMRARAAQRRRLPRLRCTNCGHTSVLSQPRTAKRCSKCRRIAWEPDPGLVVSVEHGEVRR